MKFEYDTKSKFSFSIVFVDFYCEDFRKKEPFYCSFLGPFREYPENKSSHLLVSKKKYLSDPQKIFKNIATQDFFALPSCFEQITKTNNDIQLFTHNSSPIVQQLILRNNHCKLDSFNYLFK